MHTAEELKSDCPSFLADRLNRLAAFDNGVWATSVAQARHFAYRGTSQRSFEAFHAGLQVPFEGTITGDALKLQMRSRVLVDISHNATVRVESWLQSRDTSQSAPSSESYLQRSRRGKASFGCMAAVLKSWTASDERSNALSENSPRSGWRRRRTARSSWPHRKRAPSPS